MKTILFTLFLFCTATAFSQTQMELNRDAAAAYKKADKELNQVYNQLVAMLNEKEKARLVKAQRAWITFRDAHAHFSAGMYEGGSMQPLMHATAMKEVTMQRIEQLKQEIKAWDN